MKIDISHERQLVADVACRGERSAPEWTYERVKQCGKLPSPDKSREVRMAWHLSGQLIEACSCKSACPCVLGPAEPDQGWCSGALTFSIDKGQSDGVDLSGRALVWLVDLPKDFAGGNGTVCLIIDDGADARQRQELEGIFSGKK
ncbi:MAG: DUF1326 domain-containing protein, partial [Deltaproteobacteria bacterium]|nr:DUF1326 domain-containing protein [Deltaproteobacteria bacterium]